MTKGFAVLERHFELKTPTADKTKLLYYVNKLIGVQRFCIPPSVVPNILAIAYEKDHPSFAQYYKIISCFWFMQGLTKLFCLFIRHCS